jgi:hypothetical protein
MKKLVLVTALILAASPVTAQVATSNGRESGESAQSSPSQGPVTGAICMEEMTATFCNVPTAPSNGGYGNGSVAAGSSAPPAAIPPCPEFPPANELCN